MLRLTAPTNVQEANYASGQKCEATWFGNIDRARTNVGWYEAGSESVVIPALVIQILCHRRVYYSDCCIPSVRSGEVLESTYEVNRARIICYVIEFAVIATREGDVEIGRLVGPKIAINPEVRWSIASEVGGGISELRGAVCLLRVQKHTIRSPHPVDSHMQFEVCHRLIGVILDKFARDRPS